MRIAGTATLAAPPAEVYDSMQDGRVLAATIPGVQSLEQLSDDHYKLSITAGVAAIRLAAKSRALAAKTIFFNISQKS